uniref:Uncharacterized protein n=1 Tax=Anguilla anguilla TaxID=7936 RepID=A0A0E9REM4_ANGAN
MTHFMIFFCFALLY